MQKILLFSILTFKFDTSTKFQITVIISNSHNYHKIYYNKLCHHTEQDTYILVPNLIKYFYAV